MEDTQLTLFGKTYPAHSAPKKEKISGSSSKNSAKSAKKTPLYLDLRTNGEQQDASWEIGGPLLGEYLMHSFGECPSVAVESHLSWILEADVPRKYYLSAKACEGILRRAKKRGKELPPVLKEALEAQLHSKYVGGCDGGGTGIQAECITPRECFSMHQNASGEVRTGNISNTLSTNGNATGRNAPLICIPINTQVATRYISMGRGTGFGIANEGDPAYTLEAGHSHAVMCLQGSMIGRADKNGPQGDGINQDVSFTLNATDRHAVMCMATGQGNAEILHDTSPTLNCDHEQPICLHPDISGTICASGAGTDRPAGQGNEGDLCIVTALHDPCCTLDASYYKGAGERNGIEREVIAQGSKSHFIVRRLTPLECERLQGYPDEWVHVPDYIGTDGKKRKVSDSAMYKALGNSISIPNWKYVMKRIAATFERDATLGSLFDGIGGFPMIWEQLNGKGSARWASEIEEFAIAVTKYRIG